MINDCRLSGISGMCHIILRKIFALAVLGTAVAATPAQAVEVSFSGESNPTPLDTLIGHDDMGGGLGDPWQTRNGALVPPVTSTFGMADAVGSAQPFNPVRFSNGLSFTTSIQLTINKSPSGAGSNGILQTGSDLAGPLNHLPVEPAAEPSRLSTWTPTKELPDPVAALIHRVVFAAPPATKLAQGTNFPVDINRPGSLEDLTDQPAADLSTIAARIPTQELSHHTGDFIHRVVFAAPPGTVSVNSPGGLKDDSGFSAPFDDWRPLQLQADLPEPGTIALMGLGLLLVVARRQRS